MSKTLLLLFSLIISGLCKAQDAQQNTNLEQQLENQAEADEAETEDDSYQQQLQTYKKHQLNLNEVSFTDLRNFRQLTDLQINNFLQYRRLLGKLLSIYELQAVPDWDVETISLLKPYIKVTNAVSLTDDLKTRFSKGDNSLLLRVSQGVEKSKGYVPDSSGNSKYLGSPQRIFFRYKYQYKNLLQFGIVGDKDAGEQFLKGAQKNGFDFYSIHLFARNIGIVKRLALGDFTVNLGQGLLSYQSLAFRKSVDIMNIKRQSEVFRPYSSAGEYNFHRGIAITVGSEKWQTSAFASYKKMSANIIETEDTLNAEDAASSLLTNGYNRTINELKDRNSLTQTTLGARLQYRNNRLMLGANAIHYQFSHLLQKQDLPYNLYAFSGKRLSGFSGDYGYTFRNVHLFGEVASDQKGSMAIVSGLIASLHSRVDFSAFYRNIAKDYNSLYSNAFTESTAPINERGFYTGISVKPWKLLRFDFYADVYSFPWLRYRVDRSSGGADFLIQLTWKPNKILEFYTRLKSETKAINYPSDGRPFSETADVPRQNWRMNVSYKITPSVSVRARTETVWYNKKGKTSETGFLMFTDLIYNPMMSPFSFSTRFQYFETDGYNSRIYAYENDVLYSYTIPVFSGKGYRSYANLRYDVSKNISTWLRLSRTKYIEASSTGSGYDYIDKNHKTEIRFQVIYNF